MAAEPLRVSDAARRLGIATRDLLALIREQKIRYVMVDGIAHVVFVRSSHAHARLVELDVEAARKAPGVIAVITAADVDAFPPIGMARSRT